MQGRGTFTDDNAFEFTAMATFPFRLTGAYELVFRLDLRQLPYGRGAREASRPPPFRCQTTGFCLRRQLCDGTPSPENCFMVEDCSTCSVPKKTIRIFWY